MAPQYQHYGWECSPYSSKTRAYLRYKQIPHADHYPTAWQMKRIIQKRLGFMVMPVVLQPSGFLIQDSEVIIDILEADFPEHQVDPISPRQAMISFLFTLHADEWLPLISMHTRWNIPENVKFIQGDFGRNMFPRLPSLLHPWLGKPIAKKMSSYLPILGITKKTQPAIEDWLKQLLDQLDLHFSQHSYLLGSKPCRGDFALFGQLYAHVRRDPGSSHFVIQRSNVDAWIERMKKPTHQADQRYLDNDFVPETLFPILRRIFQEQFPVLQQTIESVEKWCDENPQTNKIPRGLGELHLKIGEVEEKRKNLSFAYWKIQRLLDDYNLWSESEQSQVHELLAKVGGEKLANIRLRYKLKMENYRLVVDGTS